MGTWYNLKVGTWNLKYMPLNPTSKEYQDVDKNGHPLMRVAGKLEKGYFLNEQTGEKHDTAFKLINGKPFAKLSKTKEVKNYKEVDLNEVDDLIVEKEYIVECDSLREDLLETDKALVFGFCSGNGYKVYKAYIHTSKLYKGYLFMTLGTTQKSSILKSLEEVQKKKDKIREVELIVQGVERAKVEDLIEI